MSVNPELDAEIRRLTDEIAARRAEAARLRAGLEQQRDGLAQVERDLAGAPSAVAEPEPPPAPSAGPPPAAEPAPPRPPPAAERAVAGEPIEFAIPPDGRALVLRSGADAAGALGLPDPIAFPPPLPGAERGHAEGGTAAIAALEAQRAEGATHLVLPPDRRDYIERSPGFLMHVTDRYRTVAEGDGWSIHELGFDPAVRRPWTNHLDQIFAEHRARHGGEFAILDCGADLGVAGRRIPGCTAFSPPSSSPPLPYLADSIELVAVGRDPSPALLSELRRVARNALIRPADGAGPTDHFAVEWLREPDRERPATSVIIPTYNAAGILDDCLRAIHETASAAVPAEVVVVDDASADATTATLDRWRARVDWLRVVRNDENKGFLESCNAGAAAASGELLVFLNNDTLPLPGWLLPLVETLVDVPDAGAVGGKLVYPTGALQEAGGVIFSDAGGANFGRNDSNPDRPLYGFLRDVHYCSGALLATPAALFRELDGFDTHFNPGYYEETDYCFRVRRAGARVLFEPESAIVHLEGATAGTDEASGMKRYQAINREKFRERWADELEGCPDPPRVFNELTWHALSRTAPGPSR